MITVKFWVGIIFWCMNNDCGMITTTTLFDSKQDCLYEVRKMEKQLKDDPTPKNIVDGRCSNHTLNVNVDRKI